MLIIEFFHEDTDANMRMACILKQANIGHEIFIYSQLHISFHFIEMGERRTIAGYTTN